MKKKPDFTRHAWSSCITRSSLGPQIFYVKKVGKLRSVILNQLEDLGAPADYMFMGAPGYPGPQPIYTKVAFADGGLMQIDGNPLGLEGFWVFGYSAHRVVLDLLGIRQPRRLKNEPSWTKNVDLKNQLIEQIHTEKGSLDARLKLLCGIYDADDIRNRLPQICGWE
jgi:hypothetical protein